MSQAPFRPRPRVEPRTEAFWRSGRDGVLAITRCGACGYFVHPPGPVCPRCAGRDLAPTPVRGTGRVVACTVNHQAWYPGWETPYVVAIVELDEQPGLRLTTNVVGCAHHAVHIGMAVRVEFLRLAGDSDGERDDVWLPQFAPLPATGSGPA